MISVACEGIGQDTEAFLESELLWLARRDDEP
jgi:hypothetical protein